MKNLVVFIMLVFALQSNAQIVTPIKWSVTANKISATEYELTATAIIQKGWHLYSQTVGPDGPEPTKFTFESNKNYLKKGNTQEEKGHVVNDPIFNMQIKFFENKATFKQRVLIKSKTPFKIKAVVEFMSCDDTRCLPSTEQELIFSINNSKK
jgi:hypothetical protein